MGTNYNSVFLLLSFIFYFFYCYRLFYTFFIVVILIHGILFLFLIHRYEEANQYELDIEAAMGTNDFELALEIQQAAKERFETLQEDEVICK